MSPVPDDAVPYLRPFTYLSNYAVLFNARLFRIFPPTLTLGVG